MTTHPTAPSWNTFKGHNKPESFRYFGMVPKAPKAQGTVCRMEKGRYGGYDVVEVATGEKVASFGSAGKFWAAPAEEATEPAPAEERPTEDPRVVLPAEAPKMTADLLTDLAQWFDIDDPAFADPVGAAHADPAHPHHRLAVRLADAARELFRVEEERDSLTSELIADTCAMTAAPGNLVRYRHAANVAAQAERVRVATGRALAAEGELRARMAEWIRAQR